MSVSLVVMAIVLPLSTLSLLLCCRYQLAQKRIQELEGSDFSRSLPRSLSCLLARFHTLSLSRSPFPLLVALLSFSLAFPLSLSLFPSLVSCARMSCHQ